MKTRNTLMMTAAAVLLSTAAMADNMSDTEKRYDATRSNTVNSVDGNVSSEDTVATDSNYSDVNPSAGMDTGATTTAATNLDTDMIEKIQTSLADEGYSIRADGVWGPKTASALRQFQQANGLTASGMVDNETLAALDINKGM